MQRNSTNFNMINNDIVIKFNNLDRVFYFVKENALDIEYKNSVSDCHMKYNLSIYVFDDYEFIAESVRDYKNYYVKYKGIRVYLDDNEAKYLYDDIKRLFNLIKEIKKCNQKTN